MTFLSKQHYLLIKEFAFNGNVIDVGHTTSPIFLIDDVIKQRLQNVSKSKHTFLHLQNSYLTRKLTLYIDMYAFQQAVGYDYSPINSNLVLLLDNGPMTSLIQNGTFHRNDVTDK